MSTDTVLTDVKSPQGILLSIVAALNGGKIPEAVDAFNDEFTFNDHALGLAFTDKTRLTEFFQKSRELFPDTVVTVTSTFESRNHTIAQWKLAETQPLPYGSGSMYFRRPFSLIGVSVVQIKDARIIRLSDYYYIATSRRTPLYSF